MTRLSIIIPVYNVEKYISRCLDSIFRLGLQEQEYEVICVDDCSTDSSSAIIDEYVASHPNLIHLFHKNNKKQGGARNTGINYSKGEYIVFVDADDFLPTVDYETLLDYMDNNQLELLIGSANILKKDGTVLRWGNAPLSESRIMTGPELFIEEYINRIAYGVVWIGVYKSSLVKRIKPFRENVPYEDTDWTMQCAYDSIRVQFKPILLYYYVENVSSTTKALSIMSLVDRVKQSLIVWNWAQSTEQYHNEVMYAIEDYCSWNLSCLKSLKNFNNTNRKLFYNSFSNDEFRIMKQWKMGGGWMKIIKYPSFYRFGLNVISPLYRLGRLLKRLM